MGVAQPSSAGIRKLPEATVNRIAAGEVVERPASALKELVENALDAGARRISISIASGGQSLIVVEDDGEGMDEAALRLAVLRHATSKLPLLPGGEDDLQRISTLGFRGEALPSIGAAGRLAILSRTRTSEGHAIRIEGGQDFGVEPAGYLAPGLSGTRVEVRDLFFATPARLKFLKSARAESLACLDAAKRLAMARSDVAFSFSDDGRIVFALDAEGTLFEARLQRLSKLMGRDFAGNAARIEATREELTLTGFAGLPTYNRASGSAQFLFVNDRPVKDRLLLGAVKGAYADYLAKDRHPAVALFIECDPAFVDVNVHPAKAEVRFRDAGLVRGLIVGALKTALHEESHRASSTVSGAALEAFRLTSQPFVSDPVQRQLAGFADALRPFLHHAPASPPPRHLDAVRQTSPQIAHSCVDASPAPPHATEFPLGRARGQLHGCYIVAETASGMVIVDQHAAHERIVYERMKEARNAGGVTRQPLLIPEVIELDESECARLLAQSDALASLGLIVESFGPGAVLIREAPAALIGADLACLVRDIADGLTENDSVSSLEERLNHVLATLACHSSVRAGRKLEPAEMDALLREMESTPHSGQCNHGRPTYVELKLADIERLFGRH